VKLISNIAKFQKKALLFYLSKTLPISNANDFVKAQFLERFCSLLLSGKFLHMVLLLYSEFGHSSHICPTGRCSLRALFFCFFIKVF